MDEIKRAIHAKIVELAAQLGHDSKALKYDQEIPATGWLDSAALMELLFWFESTYGLNIEQDQITIENFGTIDAMSSFWERNRTGSAHNP